MDYMVKKYHTMSNSIIEGSTTMSNLPNWSVRKNPLAPLLKQNWFRGAKYCTRIFHQTFKVEVFRSSVWKEVFQGVPRDFRPLNVV